jgi:hypothetical protein
LLGVSEGLGAPSPREWRQSLDALERTSLRLPSLLILRTDRDSGLDPVEKSRTRRMWPYSDIKE